MNYSFLHLWEGLFFCGVNYGDKLKEKNTKGNLKMTYAPSSKENPEGVWIENMHRRRTFIPMSAIRSMEPSDQAPLKEPVNVSHPMVKTISHAQVGVPHTTAQVSTPQDTVQRRAGKPPKYQGEKSE